MSEYHFSRTYHPTSHILKGGGDWSCGKSDQRCAGAARSTAVKYKTNKCFENAKIRINEHRPNSLNIFFRLVKHLLNALLKLNQSQFTTNEDLPWRFGLYQRPCQKKMKLILLPVLATVVMWRGKKSVVRVAQYVAALIPVQDTVR